MARFLIAAFEGDFISSLDVIACACGKKPKGTVQLFSDWGSVAPHIGQAGMLVAGYVGNWSVLCDDGSITGLLFDDLKLGKNLAKQFDIRVVSAVGEDTGCVYGYRVYSKSGTRGVVVSEQGEQVFGEHFPGEPPVLVEDFNEESVLEILKLLGIDIEDGLDASNKCGIIPFNESPWWKIW